MFANLLFTLVLPTIDKQATVTTQSRDYQVSVITEQRVPVPKCTQRGFKIVCKNTMQLRKIDTPLFQLNLTHPEKLYRNSTGEITVTVVGLNLVEGDKDQNEGNEELLADLLVFSKHFSFIPDSKSSISLILGNSQILHFDANGKESDGLRKILVQSKLKKALDNFPRSSEWSRESIDIEVVPPPIFLGLNESTLKGIQILSAGLGLPALILFFLTFYFNRWRDKKEKQVKNDESRIIVP